ncbi:hypothetical protein RND81_10G209600 [Saponaria officinalis]|uniref:UspA domain-containing protein n=1 Tax=Saponaria officinalis TaxID=3572 RepID=A0AAW1I756_SAPOF
MEERHIVVVVEDAEVAKTALKWALLNILRYGDVLTLVHVFPHCSQRSRTKKKLRLLRLKGYQLALSFKDICISSSFNTKIEIVVTEDDEEGERIVELVKEMGAFALVLGLHPLSFLYRLAIRHSNIRNTFNCKVHAVRQPRPSSSSTTSRSSFGTTLGGLPDLEFSQIDVAPLQFPELPPQKIPYQICPTPSAIIWRSKKTRRRTTDTLA